MFQPIIDYFRGAIEELKKVKWPERAQVVRDTVFVIIASVVTAIFLGSLDFGFQTLLREATQLDQPTQESTSPIDANNLPPSPEE
jgi:preprotein translocase subunit SecE